MSVTSLSALNAVGTEAFVEALGAVFENAPWVARAVVSERPFATVDALHATMMAAVRARPRAERLAFLRGHPDLAGKAMRAGAVTDASRDEQSSAGLDRLSDEEFERFGRLNRAYRERFGFPFIVAVRRHTKESILAAFEERLGHDEPREIERALEEIGHITRIRLEQVLGTGGR